MKSSESGVFACAANFISLDRFSAFTNPDAPREFGMPFKGVLPLEPPLNLFVWPPESISKQEKPALERLTPAPAAPRPEFGCYPQASEYILNSEPDHSYRAGLRYAAPFNTEDMEIASQQMLNIQMPPNIQPSRFDFTTQSFVCDPIPGMVKIPIGIPMVHHINGDPNRAVTIVCAHTLDSLMHYEEGPKVKDLIPRLMTLTWGVAATDMSPRIPGIFELPGLQRNLRSKDVDLTKIATGDGSFNLASTHGEGEGSGIIMPAVQTNTPQAARIIKEVLQILHQLYRLIMPLCISRFEWDMLEFNGLENNVVAFGGIEPGPTGCQLNSSSPVNLVDLNAGLNAARGTQADDPSSLGMFLLLSQISRRIIPQSTFNHHPTIHAPISPLLRPPHPCITQSVRVRFYSGLK